MMRWVLLMALGWFWTTPAEACSCLRSGGRPCEAYNGGEGLLFTATAVEKGEFRVRLRVMESFRGELAPGAEVDFKDFGTSACDYPFVPGRSYLVYASHSSKGMLSASICGSTKSLEAAADDLAYIRAAQRGETPTSIMGTVSGRVREGVRDPAFTRPLAGVKVTAVGPTRGAATTDAEGRYAIAGLTPGEYEVQTGLTDMFAGQRPKTVRVVANRCTTFDQLATKVGSIRGRIVDAQGAPVVGWAVVALPAGDERPDDWREPISAGATADDGRYEIRDLAPGRYHVGLDHQAQTQPMKFPWPRVTGPAVVTVRAAEMAVVGDLKMPPPYEPATIRGTLLAPDGKPAMGASVVLTMQGRGAGTQLETHQAGFELPVLRGQRYRVSGFMDELGSHRHSAFVEVVAGEGGELRLTIDQAGDGGGINPW